MTCVVLDRVVQVTLLYKNSSNWRTQEDAIASDVVNNLKGSGMIYIFLLSFHIKGRKSGSKKPGHDDQKLYCECNTKFDYVLRFSCINETLIDKG